MPTDMVVPVSEDMLAGCHFIRGDDYLFGVLLQCAKESFNSSILPRAGHFCGLVLYT
jgi:hypothetical protein